MNPLASLRSLFRRSRAERELQKELDFHLEMQTQQNLRAGLDTAAARQAALRSFGGVAQVQEECRDAWGVRLFDNLRQDAAYEVITPFELMVAPAGGF